MEYSIAILAGGKSERFGSNKALFLLDGMPLLTRFLREIPKMHVRPQVAYLSLHNQTQWQETVKTLQMYQTVTPIIESAGLFSFASPLQSNNITIQLVFDTDLEVANTIRAPIFGFHSVFQVAKRGFIQFTPCDMPFFNADVLDTFYTFCQLHKWNFDVLMPKWENNFIEPLNGVYRAEKFAPIIERNIKEKKYALRDLITKDCVQLSFPIDKELLRAGKQVFQNLNSKP